MAGFTVLWASEFIRPARECYEANFPDTHVDGRDIREVNGEEILEMIGLEPGELDLLDGSPPCASFSPAGSRESLWGQTKEYSEGKQRTDDLFFEFARILKTLRPRVFVAENVKGLVTGKARGYFKEILARLTSCGYRVKARGLDAKLLGVPQSRPRLIFVGVRRDLGVEPVHPRPLPFRYTIADAIADLPEDFENVKAWGERVAGGCAQTPRDNIPASRFLNDDLDRSAIGRFAIGREWARLLPGQRSEKYFQLRRGSLWKPCPCIQAKGGHPGVAGPTHPIEPRKFTTAELLRLCGFPDDFELSGNYAQRWERVGRAVPPVMMFYIARTVRDLLLQYDSKESWRHDPEDLIGPLRVGGSS